MWATISLCVYGVGTPAMFLTVLTYYRKEIKVDQVLRKTGLGYTRASNPHFAMRRRCVRGGVVVCALRVHGCPCMCVLFTPTVCKFVLVCVSVHACVKLVRACVLPRLCARASEHVSTVDLYIELAFLSLLLHTARVCGPRGIMGISVAVRGVTV